jgi:hypothetical protein
LSGRFESVQQRHADVQYNDIRMKVTSDGQQRPSVRHRANDLAFRLQQPDAGFGKHAMVIGEQDARTLHGILLLL